MRRISMLEKYTNKHLIPRVVDEILRDSSYCNIMLKLANIPFPKEDEYCDVCGGIANDGQRVSLNDNAYHWDEVYKSAWCCMKCFNSVTLYEIFN